MSNVAGWEITNDSGETITIEVVDLNWPVSNDALFNIFVDGTVVWSDEDPPPSAHIVSWIGSQSTREVDSSADLEVIFGTNAAGSGYNLLITFDNGCQASAGN
jgi:hypothetical protein